MNKLHFNVLNIRWFQAKPATKRPAGEAKATAAKKSATSAKPADKKNVAKKPAAKKATAAKTVRIQLCFCNFVIASNTENLQFAFVVFDLG